MKVIEKAQSFTEKNSVYPLFFSQQLSETTVRSQRITPSSHKNEESYQVLN